MSKETHFNQNYFSDDLREKKDDTSLEVYFGHLRTYLSRTDGDLLDIGCGTGIALRSAREKGFVPHGIDISEHAIEACISDGIDATVADANVRLPYDDDFFQAILALDVIEHLDSPPVLCREMYRILKPGGVAIVTTPNINALSRFILRDKWLGLSDPSHLVFFSRYTLEYLLSHTGFEVLQSQTYSFRENFATRFVAEKIFRAGGQVCTIVRKPQ